MAVISEEKMIKKFKFMTNTTEAAKKKMLPEKQIFCLICNNIITERQVYEHEVNCKVDGNTWKFFHNKCYKAGGFV